MDAEREQAIRERVASGYIERETDWPIPWMAAQEDVPYLLAEVDALRRRLETATAALDGVRDYLIRAHVMIPNGQPEYRECRAWIDRLEPYDSHADRMRAALDAATDAAGRTT